MNHMRNNILRLWILFSMKCKLEAFALPQGHNLTATTGNNYKVINITESSNIIAETTLSVIDIETTAYRDSVPMSTTEVIKATDVTPIDGEYEATTDYVITTEDKNYDIATPSDNKIITTELPTTPVDAKLNNGDLDSVVAYVGSASEYVSAIQYIPRRGETTTEKPYVVETTTSAIKAKEFETSTPSTITDSTTFDKTTTSITTTEVQRADEKMEEQISNPVIKELTKESGYTTFTFSDTSLLMESSGEVRSDIKDKDDIKIQKEIYTVSPNIKRYKKLEMKPPKPYFRDPDDNSWRNESISSLGISIKTKSSTTKPFSFKNRTLSLLNESQTTDAVTSFNEELRDRLERLSQQRKAKKKYPNEMFEEVSSTSRGQINMQPKIVENFFKSDFVATPAPTTRKQPKTQDLMNYSDYDDTYDEYYEVQVPPKPLSRPLIHQSYPSIKPRLTSTSSVRGTELYDIPILTTGEYKTTDKKKFTIESTAYMTSPHITYNSTVWHPKQTSLATNFEKISPPGFDVYGAPLLLSTLNFQPTKMIDETWTNNVRIATEKTTHPTVATEHKIWKELPHNLQLSTVKPTFHFEIQIQTENSLTPPMPKMTIAHTSERPTNSLDPAAKEYVDKLITNMAEPTRYIRKHLDNRPPVPDNIRDYYNRKRQNEYDDSEYLQN